jgi:hypothetical protein
MWRKDAKLNLFEAGKKRWVELQQGSMDLGVT